jgi:hypothetical protein
MTTARRYDFRLGHPIPTGPALDHLCPVCEGDGAVASNECYCNSLGVVTAKQALAFAADDPVTRWRPRQQEPVPTFTGRRCSDCAFRADSVERDGKIAGHLYQSMVRSNGPDQPFYCHTGMHHGHQGYVPRQRDVRGAPIGHPICAGWLAQYKRSINAT